MTRYPLLITLYCPLLNVYYRVVVLPVTSRLRWYCVPDLNLLPTFVVLGAYDVTVRLLTYRVYGTLVPLCSTELRDVVDAFTGFLDLHTDCVVAFLRTVPEQVT